MLFQGERIGTPGLYIRNAQYKNRGVYECVAESTIHSTSRAATVKVVGMYSFNLKLYRLLEDKKFKYNMLLWALTE